jgi:hypothetical protein
VVTLLFSNATGTGFDSEQGKPLLCSLNIASMTGSEEWSSWMTIVSAVAVLGLRLVDVEDGALSVSTDATPRIMINQFGGY